MLLLALVIKYKHMDPGRDTPFLIFSKKEIKTIKTERKLKQKLDASYLIFNRLEIKIIKKKNEQKLNKTNNEKNTFPFRYLAEKKLYQ